MFKIRNLGKKEEPIIELYLDQETDGVAIRTARNDFYLVVFNDDGTMQRCRGVNVPGIKVDKQGRILLREK